MNIKDDFIKWFEPKAPKSYKSWFGKKLENKLDEINENYKASFETSLFDVELNNIGEKITEITNNLSRKAEISNDTFALYNKKTLNGAPNAIISSWIIRFLKNYDGGDSEEFREEIDELVVANDNPQTNNTFTYEEDLQNSLISQAEELFPGYHIFGKNGEGIEYSINGKRIDLLLENDVNNMLLAIEMKAGKADFRVFGQISMYLQLLEEQFKDKKINGVIIASEIDETLKIASRRDHNISLMTYQMELKLNDIQK